MLFHRKDKEELGRSNRLNSGKSDPPRAGTGGYG